MTEPCIQEKLMRITTDLKKLMELVTEDLHTENSSDRYNMGIIVGIGYAQQEIEKMIKELLLLGPGS